MVGLSKPASGPGWVIPTTAATALHLLLFGCVYLSPPTPTLSDTDTTPITMEVSLAPERAAAETPSAAPAHRLESAPAKDAASAPSKRQVQASRWAKTQLPQPSPATTGPQLPAVRPALQPGFEPSSEEIGATNLAQTAIRGTGHASSLGLSPNSGSSAVAERAVASKPRLLSSGSTCHDVISEAMFGAPAKVTLVLQVAKDGSASTTAVRADSPAALPGLTKAAHECARRLRFAPARSANGERVVAPSMVRLTISKHYSAHASHPAGKREGHI